MWLAYICPCGTSSGFVELSLADQIHLLKCCWLEILMLGLMWRSVDHPGKLIFSPDFKLNRWAIWTTFTPSVNNNAMLSCSYSALIRGKFKLYIPGEQSWTGPPTSTPSLQLPWTRTVLLPQTTTKLSSKCTPVYSLALDWHCSDQRWLWSTEYPYWSSLLLLVPPCLSPPAASTTSLD